MAAGLFFNSYPGSMKYNPTKTIINTPVVPVADAKEQLNILPAETDHDVYIEKLIGRAYGIARIYTQNDLFRTSNVLTADPANKYVFPESHLITINKVSTGENFDTEITPDQYVLAVYNDRFEITIEDMPSDPVKFEYETGFITPPDEVNHAVLVKVAELFDFDRGNYVPGNIKHSETFEMLLFHYKRLS